MKRIVFKCPKCGEVYLPRQIRIYVDLTTHLIVSVASFFVGVVYWS